MAASASRGSRGRRIGWVIAGVTVLLVGIVYLLPLILLRVGRDRAEAATRAKGPCGVSVALLRRADTLDRLAGHSPLFSAEARTARANLVVSVAGALAVCADTGGEVSERALDPAVILLGSILREVMRGPEVAHGPRNAVEAALQVLGRNREILALDRALPKGGDVRLRVDAALRLGRPDAALRIWREPGAVLVGRAAPRLLTRPAIQCLFGHLAWGLKSLGDRSWWRPGRRGSPSLVEVRAECLRRAAHAGALDALAKNAPHASAARRLDWRIDAAIARGKLEVARGLSGHRMALGAPPGVALRDLWLDVVTGHLDGVAHHPFARWLAEHPTSYGPEIYSPDDTAVLDEGRLVAVARALGASKDPALRRIAGRAWLIEAVFLGQRWDPRFAATLKRAAALDPKSLDPGFLRATIAFFHGDWKTFDAVPPSQRLARLQRARAQLLGKVPLPRGQRGPVAWSGLGIEALEPGFDQATQVARLYRSGLPAPVQMAILRRQLQPTTLSAQLYRLTVLVRQGRLLHQDVSRWVAQIAALRKMHDAQPDPGLLGAVRSADTETPVDY